MEDKRRGERTRPRPPSRSQPSLTPSPPFILFQFHQGGGLTHIIMPLFFDALVKMGYPKFTSWRLAFYMPAAMHIFAGAIIFLFGQDMPAGRTAAVRKAKNVKTNDMSWPAWRAALLNYRTWALTAVYAVTFGVEIAVDNVLSKYYQNHFKLSQTVGGGIASVSGLLNLFSRPSGGVFSDVLSNRYGHRHRITWLFVTSALAGVCMILFGALPLGLAPATVLMVLYSIFYEQACGATYALVPFVSNRSPGLVSGFVSSGGTAGAALWNGLIFKSQAQVREGGLTGGKLVAKGWESVFWGEGEALAPDALWACFLPPGSSGPPGRGGGGESGLRAAGEAAAVAPTNPIPRAARARHCVLFRSPAPPPSRPLPTQQSNYLNLGIIITIVSFTCLVISWPAWGGMFLPPKPYAVRKFKSWQRNGHVVLARLCCLSTHPVGPPVLPAPVATRGAPPSIGAAVMRWR